MSEQNQSEPRTGAPANTSETIRKTVPETERKVGSTVLKFAVIAAILVFIGLAIVTRNWIFFLLGLIIFIPYIFILMAPLWLAKSTVEADRAEDDQS